MAQGGERGSWTENFDVNIIRQYGPLGFILAFGFGSGLALGLMLVELRLTGLALIVLAGWILYYTFGAPVPSAGAGQTRSSSNYGSPSRDQSPLKGNAVGMSQVARSDVVVVAK